MDFEVSVKFRISAEARWWVAKVYGKGGADVLFEATARTRLEALEIATGWCRSRRARAVSQVNR